MSEEAQQQVSRSVKAGSETYTIGRFKGYKAFRLGRLLTSLGEIGPKVSERMNKFVVDYRSQNVDEIERATLEFRYPLEAANVSEEAWKESGGKIRLANDPSQAEVMAVVLPAIFEFAGDAIFDLLAWVVADDAKLEECDNEGEEAIKKYIGELRRSLMFNAEVDQLLELATAAQEVLTEQLAGKADQARSLLKLVGLDTSQEETPPAETEEEKPETEEDGRTAASPEFEPESKDATPSTPESQTTSQKPDSSTDSQPPTGGGETTSSTDQAGELSASTSG